MNTKERLEGVTRTYFLELPAKQKEEVDLLLAGEIFSCTDPNKAWILSKRALDLETEARKRIFTHQKLIECFIPAIIEQLEDFCRERLRNEHVNSPKKKGKVEIVYTDHQLLEEYVSLTIKLGANPRPIDINREYAEKHAENNRFPCAGTFKYRFGSLDTIYQRFKKPINKLSRFRSP